MLFTVFLIVEVKAESVVYVTINAQMRTHAIVRQVFCAVPTLGVASGA